MKKFLFPFSILILIVGTIYINRIDNSTKTIAISEKAMGAAMGIGTNKDKFARFNYERNLIVDPATGNVPPNMRARELKFAQSIGQNADARSTSNIDWTSRGPANIGGRTRAFAIDVTDENTMLAGSVSGGVWKSIDAGATWYKVNTSGQNVSVTDIKQDPRPGHHNEWYYGTGELFGSSQSETGAFFLGNGLYKSTDNGETWAAINSTSNSTPQSFDSIWEGVWRIAIDPSNMEQTEIYAATIGAIHRSVNGGDSWTQVINSPLSGDISYFSDIAITSTGICYATMSKENEIVAFGLSPAGGIWRSEDGVDWDNILPDSFPPTYNRIALGINPSNENEVYFLADNVDEEFGKPGDTPIQDPQYNAMWRYLHDDTNPQWTDLTQNLPAGPDQFDDFYPQSGYNLMVAVHPTDPNVVFIGGTNLYRNDYGFNESDSTKHIGGYAIGTELWLVDSYENHHSDQHGVYFHPTNPNVMFSFNDGGISRTDNCMAQQVTWASLNNGYISTQYYTLAIDHSQESDVIMGGLQDNGTRYTDSADPMAPWTHPFGADGSFCAIPDHGEYVIVSTQNGRIFKLQLDENNETGMYERIDPALDRDEFIFIHPFTLEPSDNKVMYLPIRNKLYFNTDLDQYAFTNSFDSTMVGWNMIQDTLSIADMEFTAVEATQTPDNRVYLGTNDRKVFKIEDGQDSSSNLIEITSASFPASANVNSIAVDPRDPDKVIVVFSNYNIYSVFYSDDAGTTWSKIAGNLEANISGTGDGPSVRWAEILPLNTDSTAYFLGTSTGLYAADILDGSNTNWSQMSPEVIDNNIITYIEARSLDGFVAVGTHGYGVFSGYAELVPVDTVNTAVNEIKINDVQNIVVFPNPAEDWLEIQFDLQKSAQLSIQIFDAEGKKISAPIQRKRYLSGEQKITLPLQLPNGNYYFSIESEGFTETKLFQVLQ